MKNAKKIMSLLLTAILVVFSAIIPAYAEEPALPESEHNYANNFYQEWTYVHPEKADYLMVTFDNRTYVEPGAYYEIFFEEGENITFEDVMDKTNFYKKGDYISIFLGDGTLYGVYQGSTLAGRTLFIPDDEFKVTLTTDSNITYFGFKVTEVSTDIPEDLYILNYHFPDGSRKVVADNIRYFDPETEEIVVIPNAYIDYSLSFFGKIVGDEAVIGWRVEETGQEKVYDIYNYYEDDALYKADMYINGEAGIYNLYAITTPVCLQPEDVYSFTNSSEYFNFDGDRYYLTKENHLRLVSSVCMLGGFSPLAIPAAIGSLILIKYDDPDFFSWGGSCIGFANTVCLQKKGILDVVSTQPGATCVRDLKPTPELISLLNYYNAQGTTTFLPKNKGINPGSAEYARQLRNLCASLEAGNLVLLEFYPEDVSPLQSYHGVVASGIYTAPDGSKIILCYDENYDSYSQGYCNTKYVSADYSEFGDGPDEALSFAWTDDFECYRSIDINESVSNTLPYHKALLTRIIDVIRGFFENIITMFKR